MSPYLVGFFAPLDDNAREYGAKLATKDGRALKVSCTRTFAIASPSGPNSECHPTSASQPMGELGLQFQLSDGIKLFASYTSGAVVFAINC